MRKFTTDGRLLLSIGTPGVPGDDGTHFNMPTDIAVTAAGDLFISDGYGNSRVAHFDRTGRFVKAWGKKGSAPGEFNLPHTIVVDSKGRLYVGDRNNARVQVFEQSGAFVAEWRNVLSPWGLWMTPKDELWACGPSTSAIPPKDQVIVRFDTTGRVLEQWSPPLGAAGQERPGELNWVHAIVADSAGNLFCTDIRGKRIQKFVPVTAR